MSTLQSMLKSNTVIWPKINDPRWIILAFQTCFATYALIFPWFARTPSQYLTMQATCITLDLVIGRLKTGKWIFPLSGMIAATGMFLVLDAVGVWPYLITGVVGILSKHLIRINDRHIFNPNNFGVLFTILAFSNYATITAARWGGNILWVLTFITLGFFLTYKAKRLVLSITFLTSFAFFAYLKAIILGANIKFLTIPLFSPALHLYTFFMITDPKTSPDSKKGQIAFGVLLALIDSYLRYKQDKNAVLLSLFIVCLIFNSISYWKKDLPKYETY